MKSVPPPSCYGKLTAIFVFLISFGVLQPALANPETASTGLSNRFAVPDAQADALWQYLTRQYNTANVKKLYPHLSAQTSEQLFTDVYLDDAEQSLLQNQAAVLLRKPTSGQGLMHVALELPKKLADQNFRKFTLSYSQPDFIENWLPALKPEQQAFVRDALSNFGLSQAELESKLELQQNQRQIRISENGQVLLEVTQQIVSTQKPACRFTELEITQVAQSKTAANLHQDILKQLHTQFPLMQPETVSQYGKMAALHAERPQLLVSSTVGWLGLALLFSSMSMLVIRRHRKRHI